MSDNFEKMTDLVLTSRSEEVQQVDEIILPNVPGQLYTFGSEYPGDRGSQEEFIYSDVNAKCVVNPTHFIISVDKQGQYWVQNDTRNNDRKTTRSSVFDTFVNAERVNAVEVRLLKIGDVISVGFPETDWVGAKRHLIYYAKERLIPSSSRPIEETEDDPDSPLANNLILSEIMAYLSVPDLKNARLVCKKWKDEASKVIEKKGKVSFAFDAGYRDPELSTRVSRYRHGMEGLKIQNLHIVIKPYANWSDGIPISPGIEQKMMDDLRKLLKSSHNFSNLSLQFDIKTESDFLYFHLIFQELGEKLMELKLVEKSTLVLPDNIPPFPLMTNLKKFTDAGRLFHPTRKACALLFVPLFAKSLEQFKYNGTPNLIWNKAEIYYLREFVKQEMPKLKGFIGRQVLKEESLPLLLQLKTPLTRFKIRYNNLECESEIGEDSEDCPLLESLLLKHSNSLRRIELRITCFDNQKIRIKFPPFPQLQELDLESRCISRISWGGAMDYNEHFPSLRKLRMTLPKGWDNDQVISSFFPQVGNMRCETMKDLEVDAISYPSEDPFFPTRRFEEIREMFPKAINVNILFVNEIID